MARPPKEGLDYFSFDVDLFENSKIDELTIKFGPVGEVIYFRLLCLIYREKGYYFKFESIDQLSRKLIKSIGNRWIRDEKIVAQVIPFLAKINLFSAELMQENVLTSTGVQERYQKATGRRQSQNRKYWLLSEENDEPTVDVAKTGVNDNNNEVSVYNNSINVYNKNTKSKEKESKEKESIYICSEQSSSPPIITLPLLKGDEFKVTAEYVSELKAAYPKREIETELNKMRAWLMANPMRRKTERGIKRFIVGWLNREVNAVVTVSEADKYNVNRKYTKEELDEFFNEIKDPSKVEI